MTAANKAYRYGLDKSSKKFKCPMCGHKTFVLYKNENGDYLPETVGRCDRENSCSHHQSPKQYFDSIGQQQPAGAYIDTKPVEPERVDIIPAEYLKAIKNGYCFTSFFKYLLSLFGGKDAIELAEKYNIGRSAMDDMHAVVFPQIDINGNFRSGKIVAYNEVTGKRIKEAEAMETGRGLRDYEGKYVAVQSVNYLVKKRLGNKDLSFKQCFFGEHLLSRYPNKRVAIVESEKTAIICSMYMPGYIWLATGGANGCRWREYDVFKVLANRVVTWFPDYGYYNRKTEKTCYAEWCERVAAVSAVLPGSFMVSEVVEKGLSSQPRNDEDLADILLKRDAVTGAALNDDGNTIAKFYDIAVNELLDEPIKEETTC